LSFYEKEVNKIIDEIEPAQLTLFDMGELGNSTVVQNTFDGIAPITEEDLSIAELNRLGKNQLVRKVESLILRSRNIKGISPRYVYVLEMDSKELVAQVYCLSKAKLQYIHVEKEANKKIAMRKGQLIYCDNFIKTTEGFSIAAFHTVERFEPETIQFL
jgi:hypothetical protein